MCNDPSLITHCRAIIALQKPGQFIWQTVNGLDQLPRRLHTPVSVIEAELMVQVWDKARGPARDLLHDLYTNRPAQALTAVRAVTSFRRRAA